MSPEYALDGHFSEKSDVFSFGVILLELVSGKRSTGFYPFRHSLNLLGYVSYFFPLYSLFTAQGICFPTERRCLIFIKCTYIICASPLPKKSYWWCLAFSGLAAVEGG